jgi:hypothetical protein
MVKNTAGQEFLDPQISLCPETNCWALKYQKQLSFAVFLWNFHQPPVLLAKVPSLSPDLIVMEMVLVGMTYHSVPVTMQINPNRVAMPMWRWVRIPQL